MCLRWSGDSERLELRPATPPVPLLEEQRRPNVDDARDAAPLVRDDAQPAEPQLLLQADVLHAPLSASNARSAVADDEASRRMRVGLFPLRKNYGSFDQCSKEDSPSPLVHHTLSFSPSTGSACRSLQRCKQKQQQQQQTQQRRQLQRHKRQLPRRRRRRRSSAARSRQPSRPGSPTSRSPGPCPTTKRSSRTPRATRPW